MQKRIFVTGGAGFIGSNLVRTLIKHTKHHVLCLDKLTYAGNLASLEDVRDDPRMHFVEADICDGGQLLEALKGFKPDIVMHLAAESHVDRSIDGPKAFIDTNVLGTYNLLEASRSYFQDADDNVKAGFLFHHISTDEVFGSLGDSGLFREESPYQPNSPYSASKAASDHLVRAWHHTFHLPTIITNCSNNYGPFQFPEKLIPLITLNALRGKPLPVYGEGKNIRDWLFVEDHVNALLKVVLSSKAGEAYNIGGDNEIENIDVVTAICDILDQDLGPLASVGTRRNLITYVKDRPGHDFRYAMDIRKIRKDLGWKPSLDFAEGIRLTVRWYMQEADKWCATVLKDKYRLERIGVGKDVGVERV